MKSQLWKDLDRLLDCRVGLVCLGVIVGMGALIGKLYGFIWAACATAVIPNYLVEEDCRDPSCWHNRMLPQPAWQQVLEKYVVLFAACLAAALVAFLAGIVTLRGFMLREAAQALWVGIVFGAIWLPVSYTMGSKEPGGSSYVLIQFFTNCLMCLVCLGVKHRSCIFPWGVNLLGLPVIGVSYGASLALYLRRGKEKKRRNYRPLIKAWGGMGVLVIGLGLVVLGGVWDIPVAAISGGMLVSDVGANARYNLGVKNGWAMFCLTLPIQRWRMLADCVAKSVLLSCVTAGIYAAGAFFAGVGVRRDLLLLVLASTLVLNSAYISVVLEIGAQNADTSWERLLLVLPLGAMLLFVFWFFTRRTIVEIEPRHYLLTEAYHFLPAAAVAVYLLAAAVITIWQWYKAARNFQNWEP